jgi:abortive infection bacteriophage resistance protein
MLMATAYNGQHLSFADQVQLLKNRGLVVTDDRRAARHLERIGYYRLKSYWFPFRVSTPGQLPNGRSINVPGQAFRAGTKFEYGVELYVFDKKLRLLMLDAIERVEVALRVDLAHTLGRRDPWAHRKRALLDQAIKAGDYQSWLSRADQDEKRSRLDWVQEYRRTYPGRLPIFMAVETWDFGTLTKLYQMSHQQDRTTISAKYGVPGSGMFASWLRTLNGVRNICAHHARLWNHPLVNQPSVPKPSEVADVAHLSNYTASQTRLYAAAAVCQQLMRTISPNSTWKDRLKGHWAQFPNFPALNSGQAGFMPGWRNEALWQ